MRVIYREIRHARYLYIKRNVEKVWGVRYKLGARYLSKNTVHSWKSSEWIRFGKCLVPFTAESFAFPFCFWFSEELVLSSVCHLSSEVKCKFYQLSPPIKKYSLCPFPPPRQGSGYQVYFKFEVLSCKISCSDGFTHSSNAASHLPQNCFIKVFFYDLAFLLVLLPSQVEVHPECRVLSIPISQILKPRVLWEFWTF